jgi:hypothetical protein
LQWTNTLASYKNSQIAAVKSFITLDPGGITNPRYKLLQFLTTIFFDKRRRH